MIVGPTHCDILVIAVIEAGIADLSSSLLDQLKKKQKKGLREKWGVISRADR